jgi:hypothetical protein
MPGSHGRKASEAVKTDFWRPKSVYFTLPATVFYDAPKIHQDLIDDGVRCGKNRVTRIMREAGIRSRRNISFQASPNTNVALKMGPSVTGHSVFQVCTNCYASSCSSLPFAKLHCAIDRRHLNSSLDPRK